MILGIVYFRRIILESLRNVSETTLSPAILPFVPVVPVITTPYAMKQWFKRQLAPLLLTWIKFNPNMDK